MKYFTEANQINLLHYTEDFSDMSWTKEYVIVKDNKAISPKKRPSADLIDLTNKADSRIYQMVPTLSEGSYAFTVYLKAFEGESGLFPITAFCKGKNGKYVNALVDINSENWTRATIKVSQDSVGDILVYPGNLRVKDYTLTKAYVWGGQLEKLNTILDTPKPYVGNDIIE
ncbi:hypothetical protein VOI54_04710 [Tamlana sp. 2201CG12-4]|uniref:phage head spike fiber domain-containing protein n=1 Tax=Tamlana sp. 2201CG12-4 TaxID=3112582 RepID=UPI002DB66FAD|nr:hypothetical protein [Tamlana sp. 2201CG12-4]MEC3906306.1 hypothetical protein [Tamlana sp. 2201CG12-4]